MKRDRMINWVYWVSPPLTFVHHKVMQHQLADETGILVHRPVLKEHLREDLPESN